MSVSFGTEEMLILRLKTVFGKNKKCTFLVGSGLTMPSKGNANLGVSSASEIVSSIKDIFHEHSSLHLFEEALSVIDENSNSYQKAMGVLLKCFGQEQLNEIIAHAVLRARIENATPLFISSELDFEDLEKDINGWFLNDGVKALAQLYINQNSSFVGPILTSNFDPLIEVAIKKQGFNSQSVFLVSDGKFSNTISDLALSVLHFHGYWRKDDTLHTYEQIMRSRPQLKGDLKKLLADSTLIVLGYGGWNDVFTSTLFEIVDEGLNNFNLLWCFFESDEKILIDKNKWLFDRIKDNLNQRVVLYKGIDSNIFLPKLIQALGTKEVDKIDNKSEIISELSLNTNSVIEEKSLFTCDSPPSNFYWVGREKEIELMKRREFKTIFVTGIGGQGKSALVSYFIQNCLTEAEGYEFWDWRDCKEEDNRIHSVVVSIIERITNGKVRGYQLNNEKINDVIDLLFSYLGERRIVFVFDNVDYYIDLEKVCPTRGVGRLFELANTRNHNSKFIFTCRPTIKSTSTAYLEIPLKELDLVDTINLFHQYKLPLKENDIVEIARESHVVTNGHALWLSLIAAQARRGKEAAIKCLKEVKSHSLVSTDNPSYQLAENTLSVVWKTLNQKQQILLRGMAEMVTSISEENLSKIMSSELNVNQFGKALKALRNLNLVVVKSLNEDIDLFDLHPLVKEFVLNKYKRNERTRFITMLVNFYDSLIVIIKPKLSADSPMSYFENWVHKVELQINKGDYKGALFSLQEVKEPILAAGYSESFLRVSVRLFIEIDWFKAIAEEYNYFHSVLFEFIHTLIDYGRFDEAEAYLKKYAKLIEGKGAQYIVMCNLFSYYFWSKEDFSQAIDWAEKGLDLANSTGINQDADLRHSLALAQRDSLNSENIKKAINIFLKGESLSDILSGKCKDDSLSGNYYGNIGRCLWFLNDYENAIILYKKSAKLLMSEKFTNTHINQGYAFYWIAQYYIKVGMLAKANMFYLKVLHIWRKVAPTKSLKVQKEYDEFLILNKDFQSDHLTEWDVDKFCKEDILQ